MQCVRIFLGLFLVLALVNYGAVATAAHSHTTDAFHPVHMIASDDHGHGHHNHDVNSEIASLDLDEGAPSSDHSETGFHSHSTPQFGPADANLSLAFTLISDSAAPPGPQEMASRHREKPPFKPPRIIL